MQRRDFLKLGLGGLTLPELLALRAQGGTGAAGLGKAKSCIVLFKSNMGANISSHSCICIITSYHICNNICDYWKNS